jgi:hypothetical protein
MKPYLSLLAFYLLLISCRAFSAPAGVISTVKTVYPQADGSFVIILVNDTSTCSAPSPKYFFVTPGQNGVTVDGAKAILATTLTAFALGSSISLNFDDATPSCYVNRISIS